MPAVLPAPTPTGATTLLTHSNDNNGTTVDYTTPLVVANPANPNNLFLTAVQITNSNGTTTTRVITEFSTNGGANWTNRGAIAAQRDPTIQPAANSITFTNSSSPSVAFGRDGKVYLAYLQHDAAKNSGALFVETYSFSAGAPVLLNRVVPYRWLGVDRAADPVISVDNNTPTFTDPQSGVVQTDPMMNPDGSPKVVYLAWNTVATSDGTNTVGAADYTQFGLGPQFNRSPIFAAVSVR